jgi:hypothetical protein
MSKLLTRDDLEKMSNEELVEFMTQNIPAERLKRCLQKVDEFEVDIPKMDQPKTAETFRNKCKNYPVIIVKVGPVKNQEGQWVHYYVNEGGSFNYIASPVDKFNACEDPMAVGVPQDCSVITQWVRERMKKEGTKKETLKVVLENYRRNNPNDFIMKCGEMEALVSELFGEKKQVSVEPVKMELAQRTKNARDRLSTTGVVVDRPLPQEGKNINKVVIFKPDFKGDEYIWKKQKIDIDELEDLLNRSTIAEVDSDNYNKYKDAWSASPPATRREVEAALKLSGKQPPYDFLMAGSSS